MRKFDPEGELKWFAEKDRVVYSLLTDTYILNSSG